MFATLLYLLLAAPFLLILPGFFLTKIFFRSADWIEKSTATVLLSMFATYTGLLITEKILIRLTPLNTAITILIVNLICLGVFLFARNRTHSE